MKFVIGLDIGDQRVGVAIADLTTRIARPLVTLANNRQLANALKKLRHQYPFERLVIGEPLGLSGRPTAQTHSTRTLASKLAQHLAVPVDFIDERLTSKLARQALRGARRPRQAVDEVSAMLILDTWLTRRTNG